MKIIDSFIFYNELDLLKYRLSILNDFVDYFILVESTHTFTGHPKKLFYNENKKLFDKFNQKIIHIIVDDFPYKYPNIKYNLRQQNINENYQRECIRRGIIKITTLQNNDIILFSDLDEIPDPKILFQAKNNTLLFDETNFNRLALDMYYYNLNLRVGDGQNWHGIKLMTWNVLKNTKITFQQIRMFEHTHNVNIIPYGGWHLSYFGNTKFIYNKLENFKEMEHQHQIAYNKYCENTINTAINNDINILNGNKLQKIKVKDNTNLPPQYEIYLKDYYIE